MTDDTIRPEDQEPAEDAAEETAGELEAAEVAEAQEAQAALEEELIDEGAADLDAEAEEAQARIQEAMAEAQQEGLAARARWSLVHKELLVLLFANCLFLAGVLAAWARHHPWDARARANEAASVVVVAEQALQRALVERAEDATPAREQAVEAAREALRQAGELRVAAQAPVVDRLHGLDTVRGSLIFALAIFGFVVLWINLRFRQLVVWPFLLNALFALWVGIPGFTNGVGGPSWRNAGAYLDALPSKSLLDKVMIPLSSIPPGHWMLTLGGALVLIVLLKGIISGASSSRARAAAGAGAPPAGSRRRRR